MCDQVNEVDAVHEVDKVDDVHQVDPVHQVHGNDEVRVIKQVGKLVKVKVRVRVCPCLSVSVSVRVCPCLSFGFPGISPEVPGSGFWMVFGLGALRSLRRFDGKVPQAVPAS